MTRTAGPAEPPLAAHRAGAVPGADSFRPPSVGPQANFHDADQAQAPTCAVASPMAGLAGDGPQARAFSGHLTGPRAGPASGVSVPAGSLGYSGATGLSAWQRTRRQNVGSRRPRSLLFSRRSTAIDAAQPQKGKAVEARAGASQPPSAQSKRPTRSTPASSQT